MYIKNEQAPLYLNLDEKITNFIEI